MIDSIGVEQRLPAVKHIFTLTLMSTHQQCNCLHFTVRQHISNAIFFLVVAIIHKHASVAVCVLQLSYSMWGWWQMQVKQQCTLRDSRWCLWVTEDSSFWIEFIFAEVSMKLEMFVCQSPSNTGLCLEAASHRNSLKQTMRQEHHHDIYHVEVESMVAY